MGLRVLCKLGGNQPRNDSETMARAIYRWRLPKELLTPVELAAPLRHFFGFFIAGSACAAATSEITSVNKRFERGSGFGKGPSTPWRSPAAKALTVFSTAQACCSSRAATLRESFFLILAAPKGGPQISMLSLVDDDRHFNFRSPASYYVELACFWGEANLNPKTQSIINYEATPRSSKMDASIMK